MGHEAKLRPFAVLMITLLFFGSGLAGVHASTPEGKASARATDLEPDNDNPNTAPEIISGEVIYGSLMIQRADDYYDLYHTSVPYGKVLNASLQMLDYNYSTTWQYNFNLYFLYFDGAHYTAFAASETDNKWDHITYLQVDVSQPLSVWVYVQVNQTQQGQVTTLAGNYTLSASISDPIPFSAGTYSGIMDARNGPNGRYYYKLDTTLPDNKIMRCRLQCPVNGDFDIYAYNIWPRYSHTNLGTLWQQNASFENSSLANIEEVDVGGSESSAYYIEVSAFDGAGVYQLFVDMDQNTPNDHNVPTKSMLVNDNYPHTSFADSGTDPIDWWVVNAKAGRSIPEFYFANLNGANNNLFAMIVFDNNLHFKSIKYNTQTGGWPDFGTTHPNPIMATISMKDVVVGYDGPIYICIQAIMNFDQSIHHIPSRGWYRMAFTLPNDPPQYAGGAPPITMDEDTVSQSLVLANYFSDPDGNNLTYGVMGSSYHTRPLVDNVTGLVSFTPEANWSGTETVRFRATDDGPGNKWAECNVTVMVNPVNDPPYLVPGMSVPDMTIKEGEITYTPDVTTLFADVDNLPSELKITPKVISFTTHPPGSILPIQYDVSSHSYKLGPCNLFYGSFNIQLSCTDNMPGTIPVSTSFYLNVTHVNHKPALRENIQDPMELTVKEHAKDDHLLLSDLFTDLDLPADYANDALAFCVTGAKDLLVSINEDGYLVIDTGTVQYVPGQHYEEKLLITAKDKTGLKATLNLTVYVDPVNDPPRVVTVSPTDTDIEISEGQRKLFSVTALDDDTPILSYSWSVDGKKDKNSKDYSFAFAPDFDAGPNTYTIQVDVFDGTTTVSHEWNITVDNVDRAPSGYINTPLNMTRFLKGTPVTLTAQGLDPDGDVLTFIWRDANGVELGRGATFTTDKLPKGTQKITLEINDSTLSVFEDVTVVVYTNPAPAAKSPGFDGLGAMAAIGVVLLLGAAKKLRQRKED